MIPLGPFSLDKPVAKGGMGQVWSGVHEASKTPVAVKFLTQVKHDDRRFLTAFRNEVRAVAALDHPHIATVYDHGEVGRAAHVASGSTLPLGAPWLAMELVAGGTLHDFAGRLSWRDVRHVAIALLDALAHAHAHGVIHRDLKPANVLVNWTPDGLPHVTLTDFGLAQAVEESGLSDDPHFFGGTPSYMAPEQFGGQYRDYGPWTDLYGLSCLLWALIRGSPPFGSKASFAEKKRMHQREAVPALEPPFPVPEDLEPWLKRNLAKDPSRRYRCAADALWALLCFGPVEGDETTVSANAPVEPPSKVDTLVLEGPDSGARDDTTLSIAPDDLGQVALPFARVADDIPPHPSDWRRRDSSRGTRLLGAGIGLFGLRTIPMVDRDAERDRLWAGLGEVRKSGQPRLVALTGPAGSGKSRLAEWLCIRAHQVGAAISLRAEHSPIPGAGQGLGPMLRRYLRCYGLSREETARRVESIFRSAGVDHPDEWAALTEVLQPSAGGGGIRFRSSTERFITVRRMLASLCVERPVVVWLDDVQWGLDALSFCQYALAHRGRRALPVFMVVTGADEAFAERIDEAQLLEEILARPDAERIEVGPLPDKWRATLVQGLLGLDPDLAHRVEERAGGNPQFAVQLVGDWVQRELLAPGPRGYVLRPGAVDVRLPKDVRALWTGRVARLLGARSAGEGRALELAAVLGSEVDPHEWEAVCARASRMGPGHESEPSRELLDVLLDQRFARTGPEGPDRGWTFAHAMLRESLVDRAGEFHRLREHHAACASVLGDRFADSDGTNWRLAERVGRHHLLAGQPEQAERPLLQAADARALCGDYAVADALLDLRDESLELAGISRNDERWGEGWMARYQVATGYGHYEQAQIWLDRLEVGAAAHDWPQVRVRAMCLRAAQLRLNGDYEKGLETAKRAENLASRLKAPQVHADALHLIAQTLVEQGDLSGAERWARQALSGYEEAGYDLGTARVWKLLGDVHTESGQHDQAALILRDAERRFESVGARWGMASAINSQGDVARYQGRLVEAADRYRRARGLFRAIGSAAWTFPQLNLGLVHLAKREYPEARAIFEELMPHFIARGDRRVQTDLLVGLAACAAAEQQWLMWDDHMGEAEAALQATAAADEETARLLSTAGDVAVAKGETGRALQAYVLAVSRWRVLGREVEVRHLEDFVARLESGR